MQRSRTLGELKRTNYRSVSVKEEMRANLLRKLASDEAIFPGIIGFDDTVVPQICNAILSRHNFILLGRVAAKTASCVRLSTCWTRRSRVSPGAKSMTIR
jgi:magnesium chelatase subunit I